MIISALDPNLFLTRTFLEVDTDSPHLLMLAQLEEMVSRLESPQIISRTYNNYIDNLKEEELLLFAIDVQDYLESRNAFNRRRTRREQRIYEALNEARSRSRGAGKGGK